MLKSVFSDEMLQVLYKYFIIIYHILLCSQSQMPKFSVFGQLAQRMKLPSLTMYRTFFDIVDLIYVHDTCHKCQPTCNLYSGRHRKKGGSRLASFISTVCYCSRKFDSIHQGLKKVSYHSLGQVDFLGREVKH